MAYYATYMPNELGEMQKVVINAGVGFVLPYYGETAPPGTLACDGSEISRAAYNELFAVLGTKAGAGDGSTTFNLPDLRGQFVRGTGGNAAAMGTAQEDAIRNILGTFKTCVFSTGSGVLYDVTGVFTREATSIQNDTVSPLSTQQNVHQFTFSADDVVPTAVENRPVNVALLWCIIYE